MFCHKCGNQISNDAAFCQKCGVKVVASETTEIPLRATVPESLSPSTDASVTPVRSATQRNTLVDNGGDFKKFVDNYVKTNTKFASAEDLLKNSKPMMFAWLWIFIPAFLGLFLPPFPVGIIGLGILGYGVAFFVGIVLRVKLNKRERSLKSRPAGEVNMDDLVRFLNTNLQYLSPYLSEWERVSDKTIVCKFTKKTNAVIEVLDSDYHPDNKGKRVYYVSGRKAEVFSYVAISGSGFSAGKTNAGFGEYNCHYKTAPILIAAMEYYLAKENNIDVLS